MSFVPMQGFTSNVASILLNTATTLVLPPADVNEIAAAILGGNYTILAISDGVNFEIVNAVSVASGVVNIVRAQEGTLAYTFGIGAVVRFVWTTLGIQAVSPGGGGAVTVAGAGAASVSGGPNYLVTVPTTTLSAGTGISITGSFPNFTIINTAPDVPGPPTIVTGSGVASVSSIPNGYNVNVPAVSVSAGIGISVSGVFPNFTITNTSPAGGSGSVTSVSAGTGITVTGTPSVAPIINLNNTGVVAGSYGGLTVNAQGQITNITTSVLTTITSLTPSLVVGTPSVGVISLTQQSAAIGVAGIIPIAAATAAASNNVADITSAVCPSGVNAVISALAIPTLSVLGAAQFTSLPSASYTTFAVGASVPITLPAGKKATINAFMEVFDPANPTVVQSFAFGIFNDLVLLVGNDVIPSCARNINTAIVGPYSGTILLKHTTLAGTSTLSSYGLNITYSS